MKTVPPLVSVLCLVSAILAFTLSVKSCQDSRTESNKEGKVSVIIDKPVRLPPLPPKCLKMRSVHIHGHYEAHTDSYQRMHGIYWAPIDLYADECLEYEVLSGDAGSK